MKSWLLELARSAYPGCNNQHFTLFTSQDYAQSHFSCFTKSITTFIDQAITPSARLGPFLFASAFIQRRKGLSGEKSETAKREDSRERWGEEILSAAMPTFSVSMLIALRLPQLVLIWPKGKIAHLRSCCLFSGLIPANLKSREPKAHNWLRAAFSGGEKPRQHALPELERAEGKEYGWMASALPFETPVATEAETMKKIAAKVIEDDDFRAFFEACAEKAVASLGITFTAEQVAKLRKPKQRQKGRYSGKPKHLRPPLSTPIDP